MSRVDDTTMACSSCALVLSEDRPVTRTLWPLRVLHSHAARVQPTNEGGRHPGTEGWRMRTLLLFARLVCPSVLEGGHRSPTIALVRAAMRLVDGLRRPHDAGLATLGDPSSSSQCSIDGRNAVDCCRIAH